MARELRMVHEMIRRELVTVRELAASVANGASGEEVQAQVAEMAVASPIWTLRVSCLRYCRFVHSHHGLEDSEFFPSLERVNPDLTPSIERLKSEHRTVARLLDAIEQQTGELNREPGARKALAATLDELAEHLVAHLDWEEDAIVPTLRRMTGWYA